MFFFFNDTATTEIYTLSLHDALPICPVRGRGALPLPGLRVGGDHPRGAGQHHRLLHLRPGLRLEPAVHPPPRSEEHTSELQSRQYLVCRLLLEKKKRRELLRTSKELR